MYSICIIILYIIIHLDGLEAWKGFNCCLRSVGGGGLYLFEGAYIILRAGGSLSNVHNILSTTLQK